MTKAEPCSKSWVSVQTRVRSLEDLCSLGAVQRAGMGFKGAPCGPGHLPRSVKGALLSPKKAGAGIWG